MADDRDDSQEKTEEATPKRQQESKDKGQVSRSRELNTMSVLMGGILIIMASGPYMIQSLLSLMSNNFRIERADLFNEYAIYEFGYKGMLDMMLSISPLLIGLSLLAIISPLLVGGWIFSPEAMKFKLSKLNPLSGLKRILGVNGLMELLKAMAKFFVVTTLLVVFLWHKADDFLKLGTGALGPALTDAGSEILWAVLFLSSATFLIAMVDVPFQLWQHKRQLKMTKQEVKDEMKETEGRPEVKSQIRAMQQELANRRMMEEVPKADVIITNPTHFAVALLYDQEKMRAPKVIAKGADLVAQRIRQVAEHNNVTIFSAPMLARALFHSTKIEREVPEGLYIAVAQVLAYVYQLRTSKKQWGMAEPNPPDDLSIPEEYQFEK